MSRVASDIDSNGCVFIERGDPQNGPYYSLVNESANGSRERLVNYGKQKPEYPVPDLANSLCENHLPDVPDESVDLIIDDPPYGTTQATWDNEPEWAEVADMYHRVLADDGTLVVFGKQPSLIPIYNVFTNHGFEFRFELIWKKQNNPWVSDQAPIPIHENIFVFAKSGTKAGDLTFNTDAIKREGVFVCPSCEDEINRGSYSVTRTNEGKSQTQGGWDDVYEAEGGSTRYPISYLDDHILDATVLPSHDSIDKYVSNLDSDKAAERLRQMADLIENGSKDVLEYTSVVGAHDEYMGYAGQKPTDLLSWIVLAMSERGDTVLDPHMGSGSTPAACVPLCRRSIGVEVDPERFKDADKRVNDILDELRGLKHAKVEPTDKTTRKTATPSDD